MSKKFGLYDKLEFDTSFKANFGNDLNLTDGTKNYLNFQLNKFADWQFEDVSNNTDIVYYTNPYDVELQNIINLITNIKSKCNTESILYVYANSYIDGLKQNCISSLNAVQNFYSHTNRLSGVERSSNTSIYPDLETALSLGQKLLPILYQSDQIQDNSPILGSFSSLYIDTDINNSNKTLTNNYLTVNTSIVEANTNTTITVGNSSFALGNATHYSLISNNSIIEINTNLQTIKAILDNRRTKDETFYQNSLKLSRKISKIVKFSKIGGSLQKLIQKIGTSDLKKRLGMT